MLLKLRLLYSHHVSANASHTGTLSIILSNQHLATVFHSVHTLNKKKLHKHPFCVFTCLDDAKINKAVQNDYNL